MDNEETYLNIMQVGDVPFVYFYADDGGRIVAVERIQSIVPDFKGSGSLVFLVDGEGKAIKIRMNPEEVADAFIDAQ